MKLGLIYFLVCILAVSELILLIVLKENSRWILYFPIGLSLLCFIALWRKVMLPAKMAKIGMDILSSGDFNNRLASIGEKETDKVVQLFNVMIDRLRNERLQNREQEGFLKLLLEASPMGVAIMDFDERIVMANPSFRKIMGVKKDFLSGMRIEDIASELSKELADLHLGESRVVSCGDNRRFRCYYLSFVNHGFMQHFYMIESLTEEVMEVQRQAYEKLIRTISHEVNNTMAGVNAVLETMKEINSDEMISEVIESCENRCEQLSGFIGSYAEVVKVPESILKRVDMADEINQMIPFLQKLEKRNVKVIFTPSVGPVYSFIDISLIQQVIINVVKNAIESIDREGFVKISLQKEEEGVKLEISNNGVPISQEIGRNLFSPFFTTKRGGKGIGLTLTAEILKQHDALFSLRTGEDGITRFEIFFPDK